MKFQLLEEDPEKLKARLSAKDGKTTLPPDQEEVFQQWYAGVSDKMGLNPNPDDPRQLYDYRGAFIAGEGPEGPPGEEHWPSAFKLPGHPNLIVDGINTKTGQKANQKFSELGDPEEVNARLRESAGVDEGKFEVRPGQIARRFAGGFAETFVDQFVGLAEETTNLGVYMARLFGAQNVKTLSIPKIKYIEPMEERGMLLEANFIEEISQMAGGSAGWLTAFTAASKQVALQGLSRHAVDAVALMALSTAEMRRTERITGTKFSAGNYLEAGLSAALAIPIGSAVSRGTVAAIEKIAARKLAPALKEIVSNSSVGAAFEGGALRYEGIDLTSEEGTQRMIAAILGFNIGNLFGVAFNGAMAPKTKIRQARALELTAEMASQMDVGIRPSGQKLSPELLAQYKREVAGAWYEHVTTPVLGDRTVTVKPEVLQKVFGVSLSEANQIVREKFDAGEVRISKLEGARVDLANEIGPNAVKETKFRYGGLDEATFKAWSIERSKMTKEQLDAMVPTEAEVFDTLEIAPAFLAHVDGSGRGAASETLARRQAGIAEQIGATDQLQESQETLASSIAGLIDYKPAISTFNSMFPNADRSGGLTPFEIAARERHGRQGLLPKSQAEGGRRSQVYQEGAKIPQRDLPGFETPEPVGAFGEIPGGPRAESLGEIITSNVVPSGGRGTAPPNRPHTEILQGSPAGPGRKLRPGETTLSETERPFDAIRKREFARREKEITQRLDKIQAELPSGKKNTVANRASAINAMFKGGAKATDQKFDDVLDKMFGPEQPKPVVVAKKPPPPTKAQTKAQEQAKFDRVFQVFDRSRMFMMGEAFGVNAEEIHSTSIIKGESRIVASPWPMSQAVYRTLATAKSALTRARNETKKPRLAIWKEPNDTYKIVDLRVYEDPKPGLGVALEKQRLASLQSAPLPLKDVINKAFPQGVLGNLMTSTKEALAGLDVIRAANPGREVVLQSQKSGGSLVVPRELSGFSIVDEKRLRFIVEQSKNVTAIVSDSKPLEPLTAEEIAGLRAKAEKADAAFTKKQADKKTREAKQPLNTYERELLDYVASHPEANPADARAALGNAKGTWKGISKAYLGELNAWKRMYSEFIETGGPKQLPGESARVFRDRVRATGQFQGVDMSAKDEKFIRWVQDKVDPESFGGTARKDAFIEEFMAGGFDAKEGGLADINPLAPFIVDSKPSARPEVETPAPEKGEPGPVTADEKIDIKLASQSERAKIDAEKPPLSPGESKLPLILLAATGGLLAAAQALRSDDDTDASLASLGVVGAILAMSKKGAKPFHSMTVGKLGEPKFVEEWIRKTGERRLEESGGEYRHTVETIEEFEADIRKKPGPRAKERYSFEISDAARKTVIEAGGQDPLEIKAYATSPVDPPTFKDMVMKSVLLNETILPAQRAMRHSFGKNGWEEWLEGDRKIKRQQRVKREIHDWVIQQDQELRFEEPLSKFITPKNIKSKQTVSDYDNAHDIVMALAMRTRVAENYREILDTYDRKLARANHPDGQKALEEGRAHAEHRMKMAISTSAPLPNNDKVAATVLGALSRRWIMSPETVAKEWGIELTPKVRKHAENFIRIEDTLETNTYKGALDAKIPIVAWTRGGPHSPANLPDFVFGPKSWLRRRLTPKEFLRQEHRAAAAREIIAHDIVLRARAAGFTTTHGDALKNIADAGLERGADPFGTPSLEMVNGVGKPMGNLDFHRMLDTSMGEVDLGRFLANYIYPSVNRIEHARQFGPNGEDSIHRIQAAGREGKSMVEMLRLHNHIHESMSSMQWGERSRIIRELAGFTRLILLGGSGISQLTSTTRAIPTTGFKHFFQQFIPAIQTSIAQSRVIPAAAREKWGNSETATLVAKMGQMAQAEAVSAMMELGGFFPRIATFAMKNIYATSPLDRFTRNVGNLSGHAHSRALLYGFRDAVRAGNQPEAKKRRPYIREIFAEDPDLLGEILNANYTDARLGELAILGGQIIGDRAAGNTLAAYLPLNAKHPLLGPLYSLSLFTIRMTDESYRNFDPKDPTSLVNNPAVIARWLSGMAATFGVTMGVLQLKRLMRHEDLESLDEMVEWQRVRDTLGFMGFYTGIMDGADIVMGRYGPFAERAGGPVYSKAAELIGAAGTSARTGDGRAMGRSWIYTIPKGWWNLLGVPTPKELADDAYPRKKRRPSPP